MLRKLKWVLKLGLLNLLRVGIYRFTLELGLFKLVNPIYAPITGNFISLPVDADGTQTHTVAWLAFGHMKQSYLTPPDWHESLMTKKKHPQSTQHWSDIIDFHPELGDIKGIWENSRWDWLWLMASQNKNFGLSKVDAKYVANTWLLDWSRHNPANQGPNWKCGQEASIRLIHCALAWHLFDEARVASEACIQLVFQHLERISPTIHYAVGQDNNHGTSEAAALYIGGSWLKVLGREHSDSKLIRQGYVWERQGRKWLHNRVDHLIENDGGFSQYSINYHRLMLDTLSICELWRDIFGLERFSDHYYEKMEQASLWLFNFVDHESGAVPNLGHNDGANLLPIHNVDYSDYRNSVNLCYALLKHEHLYEPLETHSLLSIFGLKTVSSSLSVKSRLFRDSGYALIKNNQSSLLFNLPVFRFRPSQNDAFHVDLFLNHQNLLRDAGSFSYAVNDDVWNQFSGVAGHNTIQFDDRQQMPRISRFLSAEWLSCFHDDNIIDRHESQAFSATYTDWCGARHSRSVELSLNGLRVVDSLSGTYRKSVLRWRLHPGTWRVGNNHVVSWENIIISVSSNYSIKRFELIKGLESRYYALSTELPVLEVEIDKTQNAMNSSSQEDDVCELVTQIVW